MVKTKKCDCDKLLTKKDEEISFLYNQLRDIKKLAEQNGSEMAQYKHKCIRLEEELNRVKSRK